LVLVAKGQLPNHAANPHVVEQLAKLENYACAYLRGG
jgi:hypothetical protein